MASDALPAGYGKCDPLTLRAVRVRRLGSLPGCLALGCADIGEAVIKYDDGHEAIALITWGKPVGPNVQRWYATETIFTPVWCGAVAGDAELILGPSKGNDPRSQWILAGLELTARDNPWKEVADGCNLQQRHN